MRVAIVKLSAMGDIVHAMVALQFLKTAYPDLEIDWVVEKGFTAVLEGNPHIHRILPVHLKAVKESPLKLMEQVRLVRSYAKSGDYDLVIDAQGLIKSAITARLLSSAVAGFSRDSIREGVASYLYRQKVDISYAANTIDRNVKVLGEPLGVEITPEMILKKEPFLFYEPSDIPDGVLCSDRRNIVFVIGSTWESRNYPKEKFAQIADALKENVLVAWGSEEERQRAAWIEARSPYAKALPKLSLQGLKGVIARCDLLIGNDTGPTHMAWGLNRPSITLFGPTPVSRVYQTPVNKVIKSSSQVDPYRLNKEDYSIREISVEEVVSVAQGLLNA